MNLPKFFRVYLISQNCSPATVKNYLSDIRDFFDWLAQKTGIHYQVAGKAIFGIFTKETIFEYQQDLLTAKTPPSTINRHLSALRKFGEFGQASGWLSENPAAKVSNISSAQARISAAPAEKKMLEEFRLSLEKEKVTPLTIKNYLSDLRHFLGWLKAS